MDGVAGHAGLFSTADDLARYCQMLLNGGVVPDCSSRASGWTEALLLKECSPAPVLVILFCSDGRPDDDALCCFGRRARRAGLGGTLTLRFRRTAASLFPLGSFGHTGFTGTRHLDRPGFADVFCFSFEPRSPGRQRRCDAAAGEGRDGRGFGDRRHAYRDISAGREHVSIPGRGADTEIQGAGTRRPMQAMPGAATASCLPRPQCKQDCLTARSHERHRYFGARRIQTT